VALSPDPSDVLLAFAEISVAFAGFSSVVAIFQRGRDAGGAGFDLFRFWVMLEHSLAALFFCVLPFPLHFLGVGDAALWASGSVALIAFALGHVAVSRTLARRGEVSVVTSLTRSLTALASVVYAVLVIAQVANLAAGASFGPYLLGVALLLLGSGVNFVRLLWVGIRSGPE